MTPPDTLITALADRYRVERELGAGGMATVYLAQDLKDTFVVGSRCHTVKPFQAPSYEPVT